MAKTIRVDLKKPYGEYYWVDIHQAKAAKDYPKEGIEKGELYWWWRYPFGETMRMRTRPRVRNLSRNIITTYFPSHPRTEKPIVTPNPRLEKSTPTPEADIAVTLPRSACYHFTNGIAQVFLHIDYINNTYYLSANKEPGFNGRDFGFSGIFGKGKLQNEDNLIRATLIMDALAFAKTLFSPVKK